MPNPPLIPQIDVANVPLAFLPKGLNPGDTFTVTLVGRNEDEGVLKLAPTPMSPQMAQSMPLPSLQNFLLGQMAQNNVVNPPPPVNP
jgi:hypothetical protein